MSAQEQRFVIVWQKVGDPTRMIPTDNEQYEISAEAAKAAGRELLALPGFSNFIPCAIMQLTPKELGDLRAVAERDDSLVTFNDIEFLILPREA